MPDDDRKALMLERIRADLERAGVILVDVAIHGSVRVGDILLVPAWFEFAVGPKPLKSIAFDDLPALPIDGELSDGATDDNHYQRWCWLRARIPALFGIAPPLGIDTLHNEGSDFPFLAVALTGKLRTVPYLCNCAERSELRFAADAAADEIAMVARAFRAVLRSEPMSLSAFRELCHVDYGQAGETILWKFDGRTMHRLVIEFEDHAPFDGFPRIAAAAPDVFPCAACNGSGTEGRFPDRIECPDCRGAGIQLWRDYV